MAIFSKKRQHDNVPFNVLDEAEELINEIWGAEIPVFAPDASLGSGPVFKDAQIVADTLRTLAELVYYSKKKSQGPLSPGADDWIKASFADRTPEHFLPGLQAVLERHFPELIHAEAAEGTASGFGPASGVDERQTLLSRWPEHLKRKSMQNYFYIRDYQRIPDAASLEAFMVACGIRESERPENHDFLMQAYHRSLVRLERLVALSHLMIAGAQSESAVNHATLERELKLQEKLKELKASYLAEHATLRLAFAKRHRGMHMLKKLNEYSAFHSKHELALAAIADRLSIGTEQYPTLINATQRMQRMYFGIGQVLLGGFLATEVIKAVSEWSGVYLHRNPYAFSIEVAKLVPGVSQERLDVLQHEFHSFEMSTVYLSVVTVVAVVGITLYYKLKNRAHGGSAEGGGGHHH
ncbi:MAG TPA: hypothetical protein VFY31_03410 [Macromonas sp.]|nr:hypothetical protein [Macromonas sp.]